MRTYKKTVCEEAELDEVFCNCCGEKIEKDKYGYLIDYFHGDKIWGYNSSLDGEEHSFDLCEKCYEKIIKSFKISL